MPTKREIYDRIMREKSTVKEKDPWYEDFGEGLVVSGQDLAYGLKDLAVGLSDEDREMLADWKRDAGESGWGTAGRVTGELAQFALPTSALKMASKVPKLTRAVSALTKNPIVRDIAQSAAMGSVRLPEGDESRMQRAGEEGVAALAGGTVGKLLSKAVKGVNITDEAKELMDAGVRLTPGQAATSKTIRGLESAAEVTPVLAQKTEKLRKRGADDWFMHVMNKANPSGMPKITKQGSEGVAQLKQNIKKGYDDAWEMADNVDPKSIDSIRDMFTESAKELAVEDTGVLNAILKNANKLSKDGGSAAKLKALDASIGKSIGKTTDRPALNLILQDAREELRKSLPDASVDALQKMDRAYPDYLTIVKAASSATRKGGKFSPDELAGAVKSVSGDVRAATGSGAMQKEMLQGAETIGRKEGGAPLEWFRRLATSFPSIVPVETGMKAALGQTAAQRGVRTYGDPVAEALRNYGITSPRFASALEDDDL